MDSRGSLRRFAWKMAKADPARARKLVEESQTQLDRPQLYLFLALGLKSRDPAAAHQAFQTAMQGIDRLMKEGPEYSAMQGGRWVVLPLVEQIDPALVPELFWRALATRLPTGNPRALHDSSAGQLGYASRLVRPRGGRRPLRADPRTHRPYRRPLSWPDRGCRVSGLVDLRPPRGRRSARAGARDRVTGRCRSRGQVPHRPISGYDS